MAPRLSNNKTTSATVVKLPARKAKGAGGAKRSSKPPGRLKTPVHAEKSKDAVKAPRPAVQAQAPAPQAAPRPAARQPTEAETRAAVQDRLVALHHNHEQVRVKETAAKEVVAELRTKRMEIRAAIQNGCVPLEVYDELQKKLSKKTKRTDNELYEKQRALAFEAFGLPCGPAPELDLTGKMPDPARAAIYWDEVGYTTATAGAGNFADPQRDGVPPENVQNYMQGHQRGTLRIGAGLKALKDDEKKPAAPAPTPEPSMVGESPEKAAAKRADKAPKIEQPDWADFDEDHDLWSDEQRGIFKTWFDALPDDADIDIEHKGVAQAFDEAAEADAPASVH